MSNAEPLPRWVLGTAIEDDYRDAVTRWMDRHRSSPEHPWRAQDRAGCPYVVMPVKPPIGLVLGQSGSGKSALLQRIADAALAMGWSVCLIDAKGLSTDAMGDWIPIARKHNAPWQWWHNDPSARQRSHPYDLWRGDPEARITKALRLLPPADGNAQVYREDEEAALRLLAGGGGSWTTTESLVGNLTHPERCITTDQRALTAIKRKGAAGLPLHQAAAGKFSNVEAAMRGMTSADGWCWDDFNSDALRFGLVSIEPGRSAAAIRFGLALLADLDNYRASRRPSGAPPLLVLIDEAMTLLSDPSHAGLLPRLFNQARSQGIGILATSQTFELLGAEGEQLLTSAPTVIIGRLNSPDPVVSIVGTRYVPELSHDPESGRTTAREQHAHRLDPQRIRELRTFRWVIYAGQADGGARLLHAFVPPVPRLGDLPPHKRHTAPYG